MTNSNDQYKVFKYYEGLCSSSDFAKEIAKVLSLGVKSNPVRDIDGNVIDKPAVLMNKNWDIVFPKPDAAYEVNRTSDGALDCTIEEFTAKINNQVDKISDTVILKTRTTPKDITDEEFDDLTVDPAQNSSYLDMYLEIYKPAYIANPEEYPLDCERKGITPKLITRGLYENSYKTKKSVEEEFTNSISGITREPRTDTSFIDYAKHIERTELKSYVDSINDIAGLSGNNAVKVPTLNESVKISINKDVAARIKQENVNLYNFIRTTMGAEPEDYILFDKINLEFSVEDVDLDLFQVLVQGELPVIQYTVAKNWSYTLKNQPIDAPVLEMRHDGVYIPIDKSKYSVSADKRTITFTDTFTYDSTREGILVTRYQYNLPNANSGEAEFITDRESLLNNHYVLMRLFDHINFEGNGPLENTYNSVGEVIKMNSHVSDWAKLSWYKDFEEVMLDHLDEDVSISSITQGSVMVPIETPGLNSDTKIRYWINTNNDRFSLIVMGNPSLDYTNDRHLVSACYCGAIDSFDNSINDTAGNFALFTSSSTEPCETKLEIVKAEKTTMPIDESSVKNTASVANHSLTADEIEFTTVGATTGKVKADHEFFISLSEGEYFNRSSWPKFRIVGLNGTVKQELASVHTRDYLLDESNAYAVRVTIDSDADVSVGDKIFIYSDTYTEKKLITSGVTRDIFGNTVSVQKASTYGKNTSDGVTSIMMYHTRSKAFYQKHHMLFATTEEYMSKVMYGKSMYTGEYYADRIKVTHGNDGPRGILSDLLVIDSASLYALDELVINKDFEKDKYENEETFIYFPITAPFSPLSDSPNATYGLAIKKEEKEPAFTEETAMLKKAIAQIDVLWENKWRKTGVDIFPIDKADGVDENGQRVSIYWKRLDDTAFKVENGNEVASSYIPLQIAVVKTSEYTGKKDENGELVEVLPNNGYDLTNNLAVKLTQGTTKSDKTTSYIKIAGFTPSQLKDEHGVVIKDDQENDLYEDVYYGISDEMINDMGFEATLLAAINDGCQDPKHPAETYTYCVTGVPYEGALDASKIEADKDDVPENEIAIVNADPSKYLVLYSAKTMDDGSKLISQFACVPLKNATGSANALLQYPSLFTSYVSFGGKIYKRGEADTIGTSIAETLEYGDTYDIVCVPDEGYELSRVCTVNEAGAVVSEYTLADIIVADGDEHTSGYETSEEDELAGGYPIIQIPSVTAELHTMITFARTSD